ncbi:hypothetical protein N0Y54_32885 [Nostoc punctiforme UO1]|uniref:hypothetical protein n=1 Tax=Nostoc punctiforme TaxID=272131 RepID=UPI0030A71D36
MMLKSWNHREFLWGVSQLALALLGQSGVSRLISPFALSCHYDPSIAPLSQYRSFGRLYI